MSTDRLKHFQWRKSANEMRKHKTIFINLFPHNFHFIAVTRMTYKEINALWYEMH